MANKPPVVTRNGLTKVGLRPGRPPLDSVVELDDIDRRILSVLQRDCKTALARIGEEVGLSAPSVVERVRKLEEVGVLTGYHARLEGRRLGLDVTAFIGVSIDFPKMIESFQREVSALPEVLEVHHVTGAHSLLLKVRTWNTATLEGLISQIRSIEGVQRTDTMVVFSTHLERSTVPLGLPEEGEPPSKAAASAPAKKPARRAPRA